MQHLAASGVAGEVRIKRGTNDRQIAVMTAFNSLSKTPRKRCLHGVHSQVRLDRINASRLRHSQHQRHHAELPGPLPAKPA